MDWRAAIGVMRVVDWGREDRRMEGGRTNRRHEPLKASILDKTLNSPLLRGFCLMIPMSRFSKSIVLGFRI